MNLQVVGSSILFVYDDAAAADGGPERGVAVSSVAAKMIDFAKTEQLPAGGRLTHTSEWEVGNREDGYLTGLDNLIEIWTDLDVTSD